MVGFRKILISILTSFMLITSIGFQFIGADEIEVVETNEEDEIAPEEVLERASNIAKDFANALSGDNNFKFGSYLAGGISGIISLSIDVLKETGIFGPSAEEIYREQLEAKLNAIDNKIGEVGEKVDSLQDSINESLKIIDSSLADISVKIDKQNLSAVANVEGSLKNEMNNLNQTINSHIRDWYNNYQFSYTDDKLVVYVKTGENEEIKINVPAEVIINELKKEDKEDWDVNRIEELVKNVFGDIALVLGLTDNEGFKELVSTLCDSKTWSELTEEEQNKVVDAFKEGGYNSIYLECGKRVAYARTSDARTYASELIGIFTNYCDYINETNDVYTSPLTSQYSIFSKLNAFQGDLKCSIEEDDGTTKKTIDTNLAEVVREQYLIRLNELGSFVSMLAIASGAYTDDDLQNLIYLPWAFAEKKMEDTYNGFYYVDDNGNPIDNYCYVTKSVLEYRTGHLNGVLDMKFYAWENGFGTDIKSYRDTWMKTDWNYSYPNDVMTSSLNMNRLYAYYQNLTSESFVDYLTRNKVEVNTEIPSTIVTNFIGGRDFTSDDKVKMFIKNCHNNPDKFEGKDFTKGDTTTVTSSSGHFKVRRKAVADVFDLAAGKSETTKRLAAVASFYEKYTFKDDLVVFWDAEYNNPETKDDILALANDEAGFYYRTRYDTSKDPEERYISEVTYDRDYGTVVSIPIEVYLSGEKEIYVREGNYTTTGLRTGFGGNEELTGEITEQLSEELDEKYNEFVSKAEAEFKKSIDKLDLSKDELLEYGNGDTYSLYFDEAKYDDISVETYLSLIEYFGNHIDKFVEEYVKLNNEILKVVRPINNSTSKKLTDNEYHDLINKLIEYELDCEVVSKVPITYQGDQLYCNDKLFIWNKNKYKEYMPNSVVIKYEEYDDEHKKPIRSKCDDDIIYMNYPSKKASDFEITYKVKTILGYELYFDGENVCHSVNPIYDITPTLTWKENGKTKYIEIPEEVYEESAIGPLNVKIPVVQVNGKNDNRAEIYHHANLTEIDYPIQTFDKDILKKDGNRYVALSLNSFSPYYVNNTYHREYVAPSTGIE